MIPQTLSAPGPSAPVQLIRPDYPALDPSVLVLVSAGASLTYTVEFKASHDTGPDSPSAVWYPLDSTAVGQTASANFQIAGPCSATRINVTSYTSGTLTWEVAQTDF